MSMRIKQSIWVKHMRQYLPHSRCSVNTAICIIVIIIIMINGPSAALSTLEPQSIRVGRGGQELSVPPP